MTKTTAAAMVPEAGTLHGQTLAREHTHVGMPHYECVRLAEQMLEGDGPNVTDEQHAAHVNELADEIQLTIDTWCDGAAR